MRSATMRLGRRMPLRLEAELVRDGRRFRKVGQDSSRKTLIRTAFQVKLLPPVSLIIFANLQGP